MAIKVFANERGFFLHLFVLLILVATLTLFIEPIQEASIESTSFESTENEYFESPRLPTGWQVKSEKYPERGTLTKNIIEQAEEIKIIAKLRPSIGTIKLKNLLEGGK